MKAASSSPPNTGGVNGVAEVSAPPGYISGVMTATARNRLLAIGVLWGVVLAAVPALVMTDPYRLSGFLVAAVVLAAVSGAIGTVISGRRATRYGARKNTAILNGVKTGFFQGLIGGSFAALFMWALMAVTLSGFSLTNPVEASVLMRPSIFLGSFFVALSAFVYVLAAGVLLGPVFGVFVNRAAIAEKG